MQAFVNLSAELRITLVWLFGFLFVGPFVTWAISSWSFFGPRSSVWIRPPSDSHISRKWPHYLPFVGWILRAKGESSTWSKWFWMRPAILELMLPIGLAAFYWWEVEGYIVPGFAVGKQIVTTDLHWQVLGHLILIPLLTVATFIDLDEMYIPDMITIPGTLIALVGAAFIPQWHLFIDDIAKPGKMSCK